jgi:branched-chain amino acid transport system ATP-binding protein
MARLRGTVGIQGGRIVSSLLEVEGIARAYGGVQAVDGVSFRVDSGEIVALIGPNGAGKSTCFNMLSGQIRPDRGTIRIGGTLVNGLAPHVIWRMGVGRTFQITATFGSMTIAENVQVALLSYRNRLSRLWGNAGAAERSGAEALLDLVGMKGFAERPSATLAYGDLKRLELAIALANEPQLLLMDEPAAGMAPKERAALMRLTADIARNRNIGVLFTEHDMDVVFEHASRIMVLSRGRLIAEGDPKAVRANEEVQAIYLGGGLTYNSHRRPEAAEAPGMPA